MNVPLNEPHNKPIYFGPLLADIVTNIDDSQDIEDGEDEPRKKMKLRRWVPRSIITFITGLMIFSGTMIGISTNIVSDGMAHYYDDGSIYLKGIYSRIAWTSQNKHIIPLSPQLVHFENIKGITSNQKEFTIQTITLTYAIINPREYIKNIIKVNGIENFIIMLRIDIVAQIAEFIKTLGFNGHTYTLKGFLLTDIDYMVITDLKLTPIITTDHYKATTFKPFKRSTFKPYKRSTFKPYKHTTKNTWNKFKLAAGVNSNTEADVNTEVNTEVNTKVNTKDLIIPIKSVKTTTEAFVDILNPMVRPMKRPMLRTEINENKTTDVIVASKSNGQPTLLPTVPPFKWGWGYPSVTIDWLDIRNRDVYKDDHANNANRRSWRLNYHQSRG